MAHATSQQGTQCYPTHGKLKKHVTGVGGKCISKGRKLHSGLKVASWSASLFAELGGDFHRNSVLDIGCCTKPDIGQNLGSD